VRQVRCARLDALRARAVELDGGGDHGVNIARNRAVRIWIRGGGDGGLAQPQELPRLRSDGVVHLALRELPRLRDQRRRQLIGGDVLLRLDQHAARLGGDGHGDALLRLVGGGVLLLLERRAARLGGGSAGDAPLRLVVTSSLGGSASTFCSRVLDLDTQQLVLLRFVLRLVLGLDAQLPVFVRLEEVDLLERVRPPRAPLRQLLRPPLSRRARAAQRILHGRRAVREIRRTLSKRILSILASAPRLDGVEVVLGASFLASTLSIGEVAFFVRLGTLLDCANICGGHWPVSLRDLGCRASLEAAGEGRKRRRFLSLEHRCCRIHRVDERYRWRRRRRRRRRCRSGGGGLVRPFRRSLLCRRGWRWRRGRRWVLEHPHHRLKLCRQLG